MTHSVTQPAPAAPARRTPTTNRWTTFSHAVAFVLGFSVVFTLLGSAFGWLGRSLDAYSPLLRQLGALLLVLFALITFGFVRRLADWISRKADLDANPAAAALVGILNSLNALFYTERRVAEMHSVNRGWGYLSSFMLGVAFSAGWVPCIGPILGSIFTLASDSATVSQGATLLAVYSLGLGLPFLATGLALERMTPFLRRLNRHAGIISIISGIFLLYVAYLLWFDQLGALTNRFSALNNLVLGIEGQVGVASGTGGELKGTSIWLGAPLAFVAGIISFISPCVLPLVPAYLGFLTGTAVGSRDSRA